MAASSAVSVGEQILVYDPSAGEVERGYLNDHTLRTATASGT